MIDATAKELVRTQLRIIGALVMRETRATYGSSQLGYLWAILNPIAAITIMAVIFSFIISNPPIGTNVPLFLGTGFLLYSFYSKLSSSMMHAINSNRPMLNYPLINTTDVIFARFILIVLTETIVILVFFSALTYADDVSVPAHIESVIVSVFATATLAFGVGMINLVIVGLWKTWSQIEGLLTRPLFFISGIFFIPTRFSPEVQYWLSWNPLLHCIEWMREGYYVTYESTILNERYLLVCALTLVVIGFGAERLYRKRLL